MTPVMTAAAEDLDLSVLPPEYRVAFEALQATAVRAAELEDIVKRLEHLVAELNHAVHGKKSEKLSENDRQLAFEDLEIAVAEVEEQSRSRRPARTNPGASEWPGATAATCPRVCRASSGWSNRTT